MTYTIQQIAEALGLTAEGDGALTVTGVAEPQSARADELAMASTPKYAEALTDGAARAALTHRRARPGRRAGRSWSRVRAGDSRSCRRFS